jgi:hypothetical protein
MSTIQEVREEQANRETSGPKCNRCAYDVTWNPQQAQKDFGKNRPYEAGLKDAHECPKDQSGYTLVRPGYQIIQTPEGKSKAICLIAQSQQQTFPSSSSSSESPSYATSSLLNEMQEQIQDLKSVIENLTMETSKLITKQNEDITILKTTVQNHIQFNPLAPMFDSLINKLIQYLPESEMKPKTADEL